MDDSEMQAVTSPPPFEQSPTPVLSPSEGSDWAGTAVLNPAILEDPKTGRLHMLFRATGPFPQRQRPGQPLPYPIFLGYAWSDDRGESWTADFSRPALAPALEVEAEKFFITNATGETVVNHANGCIEDPRLFQLGGEVWMSVACRLFPPGPYWERDEPMQCAPHWSAEAPMLFGRASSENVTVTVLYKVNLEALAAHDYANAFAYVCPITDPHGGDNRDAFLFPEKLTLDGKPKYVCLHRPHATGFFALGKPNVKPSIFLAAAERIDELATSKAQHQLLAEPRFPWEASRIGASTPPVALGNGEWLLPYHGKQDNDVGYTQSFMILQEQTRGFPKVIHRCPDRLLYARQPWELAGKFATPCVFSCAGILLGETFLIGYGAADTRIGIARAHFNTLTDHIRRFDADGCQTR